MSVLLAAASILSILIVLADGFESMVLPRRVNRRWRLARFFYRYTWKPWSALARRMEHGKRRETFLSFFGPLSMLVLLAFWAALLVISFAGLHWALGTPISPRGHTTFITYLYLSGTSFFTLGFGDVVALETAGRMLTVLECGIGFGFLAMVISYLPVLYQSFSRREVMIALLDARAGSPPTAGELLGRVVASGSFQALDDLLRDWERWAAELLESHLSFAVLTYYRSQHDNQSWLSALTAVLDASAIAITHFRDVDSYQAQVTFAVARHAAVDLALIFNTPPESPVEDRLPEAALDELAAGLVSNGLHLREPQSAAAKLAELRAMYEPFVHALSKYFLFAVPPVIRHRQAVDNWQTSAWTRRVSGIRRLVPQDVPQDDHFD